MCGVRLRHPRRAHRIKTCIRRLKRSTSTPRTTVQYGIPRFLGASRRLRRRGTILTQLLNLWPHGHGAQRTQKSRPQSLCKQRFLERALLLITVDLCARRVGRMKPRMEVPMWASRLAESRMTHQSLIGRSSRNLRKRREKPPSHSGSKLCAHGVRLS